MRRHRYEDDGVVEKDERAAKRRRRQFYGQVRELEGEVDYDHLDEVEDRDEFRSFEPIKRKNRR